LKAISCDDTNNCNFDETELETYTKDNISPIFDFVDNGTVENTI
jgi:hypothetical protein